MNGWIVVAVFRLDSVRCEQNRRFRRTVDLLVKNRFFHLHVEHVLNQQTTTGMQALHTCTGALNTESTSASTSDHGRPRRRTTPVSTKHQLRMVRSSLTSKAAKTMLPVFASSRLECNSLLYDIRDGLLTKLQTVQNAAARVVTGKNFGHITILLQC